MNHPFFSRRFSPLELSAARRLIPRATVEVPPEGMGSDRITVLFTLSDGPPPAEITLWLSPKDLLCACPLCGIEGDLPCPHAIAALEILREKAPRDIETPGESSLPPPSSPSRLVRASRRAPPPDHGPCPGGTSGGPPFRGPQGQRRPPLAGGVRTADPTGQRGGVPSYGHGPLCGRIRPVH